MSFFYSIIPSAVMYDVKLSDGAKIMYALILSLANNKGLCDATNEYLSSLLKKSDRTITYQIKELVERKYIKVDYQQFKRRVIYPIWKISTTTIKKATLMYNKFIDGEEKNKQDKVLDAVFKSIR